jgi:hypothetical protein
MLVALGVAALWRLPWRAARRALIAGLIAVSVMNLVMKADVIGGLSGTARASVPGFGEVPVVAGQGYIQGYVVSSFEARPVSATQPLPSSVKRWLPTYDRIVEAIMQPAHANGYTPLVDLATDEPLLNANDLILAARLHQHRDLIVNLIAGPPGAATAASYRHLLTGGPLRPNVVVTVSHVALSYYTLTGLHDIDQGLLERASTALGLRCSAGLALPDGRRAIVSSLSSTPTSVSPPSCVPHVTHVGLTAASTTAAVLAVFDLPMDRTSLLHSFALMNAATGEPVPGTLTPFGEIALVFRPARPLRAHTTYIATVGASATAATGARLAQVARWPIATGR